MIKTVKARMNKNEEEGFTLIELLVVVLIIGILMAIAIPTFLSLTSGAKTNAAEADLTTAAQDEATYYTTNGTYDASSSANVTDMQGVDSGINWVADTPSTSGTKSVAVHWVSTSNVLLATNGQDSNEYWINDTGGTLTYTETTVLAANKYPVSGDYSGNTSWKQLAATIKTNGGAFTS
jgi:type IV pilus assembly protein PilA